MLTIKKSFENISDKCSSESVFYNNPMSENLLSWELCRHYAGLAGYRDSFRPLFYDIETTGLAKKTTQLYLIGCVCYEEDVLTMYQWLAESPEEERDVLQAFHDFSTEFTHTIQFNGNRFDAPYIRERCNVYGLDSPIDLLPALDLYQIIKPHKLLFQMNHLKQSDVEAFIGYADRKYPDGKACITHYKNYVVKKEPQDLEFILGHNEEDLLGMIRIYPMLSYLGLLNGNWNYCGLEIADEQLLFHIRLEDSIPQRISGGIPGLYLRAEGDRLRLLADIQNGRLQQFYTNYKDYDYLISEDQAIPKSLGSYMDKSLKQPATLKTCYTWFACGEAFLKSEPMQEQYLRHAVPYMLKILSM